MEKHTLYKENAHEVQDCSLELLMSESELPSEKKNLYYQLTTDRLYMEDLTDQLPH